MAWTKVELQGHLSESNVTPTEATAKRVYVAVSDTPTTTTAAETATAGANSIPAMASALGEGDTRGRKAWGISAKPDPESVRMVFIVEVAYSSKSGSWTGIDQPENPLDRDPEISWDFSDRREPYAKDCTPSTPQMVLNTAGVQFEDFLERDTGEIRAVISRNIAHDDYDANVAVDYKDKTNLDSFSLDGFTIGIGQAKMKAYTAGPVQQENGTKFRVATWTLEFKESWDDVVESRGYTELRGDGTLWEIVKGTPPVKPDRPWPLAEDGTKMATPEAAPFEQTFIPYFTRSFSGFAPAWVYA